MGFLGGDLDAVEGHYSQIVEVALRTSNYCSSIPGVIVEAGSAARLDPLSAVNADRNLLLRMTYERSLELLRCVEKNLEPTEYVALISDVQEHLKRSKVLRKEESAKDAISNPQAFAARKVRVMCLAIIVFKPYFFASRWIWGGGNRCRESARRRNSQK